MTGLELRFYLEVHAGTTNVRKCGAWAQEKTGVKARTVISYIYGERPVPVSLLVKLGVPDPYKARNEEATGLDHFIRAISQFCRECSDEVCWDPTCSLRPVSPLPVRAK